MDLQYASYEMQSTVGVDDDGATTIEAWGELYGVRNDAGRVFVPGAFKKTIRQFNDDRPMPMGWMHQEIVGKWPKLSDSAEGLRMKGRVSQTGEGTIEHRASVLLRDRALTSVSIGFMPVEMQFAAPRERVAFQTPYGDHSYRFGDYTTYISQANLVEASLVLVGVQSEARVFAVQSLEKAAKALPVLQHQNDPSWDDAAYSMALLMGGRGAAAFVDLPDDEHYELYSKIAATYQSLGKTPPSYHRNPVYAEVTFQHDEREMFADRYLRKNLATVEAGARGIRGPLSPETQQQARAVLETLAPLTHETPSLAAELREMAGKLTALSEGS